ncbi:MAG TPA: hypothetical protein VKU82_14635 [Planctomycetaceae bacterium]|nr:hypothetical protein [Planctomycetaceae bacterium]
MDNATVFRRLVGAWVFALIVSGCESPTWTHTLNESFSANQPAGPRTEEEHRREYLATGSRRSLRWLLAHCVKPGMSYDDLCGVLGQDGELETKDLKLKTNGGNYRIDDEVYRWGPDSEGRILYLFFRENRLFNFDPDEFK